MQVWGAAARWPLVLLSLCTFEPKALYYALNPEPGTLVVVISIHMSLS